MSKPKILIVDDERFFIDVLIDLLKPDYDIALALNGKQALERTACEKPPDLILLDIVMPGMDGYEVCQRLKAKPKTRDIPIIFLTVKNEIEDETLGFEIGAVDYITKPISPPIVKARVGTHVALTKAREELQSHTRHLEELIAERTRELSREIEERKKTLDQMRYLANYDPLTKLPNRLLFQERLEQAIRQAQRNNFAIGLLLIDLDRFKQVNDTLGHHYGDQLLKQVAARLLGCVRNVDTVARQGGDEFNIALLDVKRKEDAAIVAEKIIRALSIPFKIERHELNISASVGITVYPNDGEALDALLRNVDLAMYQAKAKGRNSYEFFTPELTALAQHNMELNKDLRKALKKGELLLHYQPIVDVSSNRLVGTEALLRWNHPVKGLILPLEFIPTAEETDLIFNLDDWVIRKACQQYQAWRAQGIGDFSISVNMSSRQYSFKRDYTPLISNLIQQYKIPANRLRLEITESQMMEYSDQAIAKLEALKNLGVGLCVDDFGTGYSCLSYIRHFPIDTIKIDRSFIRESVGNSDNQALIKAIIAMGKSLSLDVIAEGVETEEQLSFLRDNGCKLIQGYYFGRPQGPDEFTKFAMKNFETVAKEKKRVSI